MPDIYNDSKTCGIEVVRCEAPNDFLFDDVIVELQKISYNNLKYLEIKQNQPDHIFNKIDLNLTIINNRICGVSKLNCGHSINWIVEKYKSTIRKKLKKLNNGNYKSCSNVSLIILNISRANGIINAKQVQQLYHQESQKYLLKFNFVYYVTTDGIYTMDTNEIKNIKFFNDNDFSLSVKKMKQLLKIDEYDSI